MKKLHIEKHYDNHIRVYTDLTSMDIEKIEGVIGIRQDIDGYFVVFIDKRQPTRDVEECIKNMVFPERKELGFWKKLFFDANNGI